VQRDRSAVFWREWATATIGHSRKYMETGRLRLGPRPGKYPDWPPFAYYTGNSVLFAVLQGEPLVGGHLSIRHPLITIDQLLLTPFPVRDLDLLISAL